MASLRLIACGFLMAALCFMLLNPTGGRNSGGPFSGETSLTTDLKKMLKGRMLKGGGGNHQLVAAAKGGNGRDVLNEELRMAPSGPDPLHHHGAGPKKPQLP
ncbi:hypothetical protein MLD38_008212 [Melastoma candidum]|uniref:Uncharacterized protein n=1 Tax=Melastoma candidum TaxID=119954 RepID=A0ACB9RUX5_9MYRT|nr:hypothetical protein MLD38_008212 [Melastoma candidum]